MKEIGVLLVDDSALVRQVVSDHLASDPGIAVIAAVADPIFAMARMRIQWPDVIIMDVDVKRVAGLTFLRKIMAERPTPVIVCSMSAAAGTQAGFEALAAGAVGLITKPQSGLKRFLDGAKASLIDAVKAAASTGALPMHASMSAPDLVPTAPAKPPRKHNADVITAPPGANPMKQTTERIVAIGTSTGGTQALERVLVGLPRDCPGIAVVQHMPEHFTAAFAARLNSLCEIEVREAVHGERLLPGHVFIAPGGRHLMLRRSGGHYVAEVVDGSPVNRHRPSVDVLFRSVAKCAGANALGAILTGMGDDGARGLLEMRQAGAATVAQDEASCVVFGMPKEAIKLAAAARVLPLSQIAKALVTWGAG
jgi:two-component system chemotaxis response regulator CheB